MPAKWVRNLSIGSVKHESFEAGGMGSGDDDKRNRIRRFGGPEADIAEARRLPAIAP